MLQPGKHQEIESELLRYKINITAIQETRWKGKGTLNRKESIILYSSSEKQGQYGVAFIITGNLKNKVINFEPINERMAYVRIEASPINISIMNVYAPTQNAKTEEKEFFYEKLEEEINKIPKEDNVMILGDFNAQIGKEEYIQNVAGKNTIHEKTNNNGQRVCRLAAKYDMFIVSTKFKHPKQHKITWVAPNQETQSQIDHILITKRKQSAIKDVRTYRGACADSDHYMVTATLKQKIKRSTKNKNKRIKWNVENLRIMKNKCDYEEI